MTTLTGHNSYYYKLRDTIQMFITDFEMILIRKKRTVHKKHASKQPKINDQKIKNYASLGRILKKKWPKMSFVTIYTYVSRSFFCKKNTPPTKISTVQQQQHRYLIVRTMCTP